MNRSMINITDVMGSKQIDINTPIIILNKVPYSYLVPIFIRTIQPNTQKKDVYYVDTDKLHNDLEKREQFINRFIPVGQIQIKRSSDSNKYHNKWFSVILANIRAVPVTTNFEEISKNTWIGVIRKGDKISRSLGVIHSEKKPVIPIPVFPESFLKKVDFKEFDQVKSENTTQKKNHSLSGSTIDNILDGALNGVINDDDNDDMNNMLMPNGGIENSFNNTYSNIDPSYSAYRNLYSTKKYGKWVLSEYKFNINNVNLKMIDSSGRIRNMHIPSKLLKNTSNIQNQNQNQDQDDNEDNIFSVGGVNDASDNMQGNQSVTPKDVIDDTNDLGISNTFDRKVFFSTQGSIESDDNCEIAKDNLNKMTMNECNAISLKKGYNSKSTRLSQNQNIVIGNNNDDDGVLYSISKKPEGFQNKKGSKWFTKGKTLVLKEKDEPWFLDARIVGNVLNTTDPHKVTGELNLIGTIDLADNVELQMPFNSNCEAPEPIIGYSRADIDEKCLGKKPPVYENFSNNNNNNNNNNVIMYIICFIILLLLIFRRR